MAPERSSRTGERCYSAIILLLALTLGGGGLRAVGLNAQLWCDEIVTLVRSVRVPVQTLVTSYFWDNQHTFYSLLAQAAVGLFGEEPWTVRLPAMVLGTLAIPALYFLARLLVGRLEAFIAAGLLAVSYHHIWYSQNARGYTALLLAALLATGFLVRSLRQADWKSWLLYSVVLCLGSYTHLTMVFLAVGQAAVCAWLWLRPAGEFKIADWRRPALAYGIAGAGTVLLYLPMLGQMAQFFGRPSPLKGVSTPKWALAEIWNGLKTGFGAELGTVELVLGLGGLLLIFGAISYFRQHRIVLALYLAPLLCTVLGALALRGTMYPRFFFYLMGFGLLLLARGATILGDTLARLLSAGRTSPRLAAVTTAVLAAGFMGLSLASLEEYYRLPKQDFEGARAFVHDSAGPDDGVLTAGVPANFCFHNYYRQPWTAVEKTSDLTNALAVHERVWLVYTFPRYLEKADPELMTEIRKVFSPVKEFRGTLKGGDILVCRAERLRSSEAKP